MGQIPYEAINLGTTRHPDDLLKLEQLQREEAPLSTSTIYSMMAKGEFPLPVPTGPRSRAWRRGDIWAWKKQQEANAEAIREAARAKREADKAKREAMAPEELAADRARKAADRAAQAARGAALRAQREAIRTAARPIAPGAEGRV